MPKSILIIKLSALGDIVQAVDAFKPFAADNPDVKVSWAVSKGYETLLDGVSGISEVISVPRRWTFSEWLKFRKEWKKREFDEVIDIQGLLKSWLVTKSVRSKGFVSFGTLNTRDWLVPRLAKKTLNGHFTSSREAYRSMFEFVLGSPVSERRNHPHLESLEMIKTVYCAPGSGQPTKILSADQWVNLFKALRKDLPNAKLQWVAGSEEEHAWVKQHQDRWRPFLVEEPEKWSLSELKEKMKRIELWVGMDSGPSHLASQSGVTTLLFYGPSSPKYYDPYPDLNFFDQGECHLHESFHDRCNKLRVCTECSSMTSIEPETSWKNFVTKLKRDGI